MVTPFETIFEKERKTNKGTKQEHQGDEPKTHPGGVQDMDKFF
jgi:hypothetical protein